MGAERRPVELIQLQNAQTGVRDHEQVLRLVGLCFDDLQLEMFLIGEEGFQIDFVIDLQLCASIMGDIDFVTIVMSKKALDAIRKMIEQNNISEPAHILQPLELEPCHGAPNSDV